MVPPAPAIGIRPRPAPLILGHGTTLVQLAGLLPRMDVGPVPCLQENVVVVFAPRRLARLLARPLRHKLVMPNRRPLAGLRPRGAPKPSLRTLRSLPPHRSQRQTNLSVRPLAGIRSRRTLRPVIAQIAHYCLSLVESRWLAGLPLRPSLRQSTSWWRRTSKGMPLLRQFRCRFHRSPGQGDASESVLLLARQLSLLREGTGGHSGDPVPVPSPRTNRARSRRVRHVETEWHPSGEEETWIQSDDEGRYNPPWDPAARPSAQQLEEIRVRSAAISKAPSMIVPRPHRQVAPTPKSAGPSPRPQPRGSAGTHAQRRWVRVEAEAEQPARGPNDPHPTVSAAPPATRERRPQRRQQASSDLYVIVVLQVPPPNIYVLYDDPELPPYMKQLIKETGPRRWVSYGRWRSAAASAPWFQASQEGPVVLFKWME